MMQAILTVQVPRSLKALLAVGMVLVVADLWGAKRPVIKTQLPAAETPVKKAQEQWVVSADPRFRTVSLACGCRVDYADQMSQPCSIRHGDGSIMIFDHLYRASSIISQSIPGRIIQFHFDDQDRVVYARHDPYETMYTFGMDGQLREVRHHEFNEYAHAIKVKAKIERGVRTRYPHMLEHPHVPAESAMGHVLAGTWKALEK